MTETPSARDWSRFDYLDIAGAARRLEGVTSRTPLVSVSTDDPRIELRAKLENRQRTGSFKARGAWNNLAELTREERRRGVVATSSGNHGKALAWAAQRAGVAATIVMPEDAYPNKIQACRDHGAAVVLAATRQAAETETARLVAEGWTLIHPYDRAGTVEGAGTVGLEIVSEWSAVEGVVVPVGGGGLLAGTSLALRRALGHRITVLGAEPEGAPTMSLGLKAGRPVTLEKVATSVQGLCPLDAGALNVAVCRQTVDAVIRLSDEEIFAAQARLVRGGEVVEPAGAAACAAVFASRLPRALLEGRKPRDPLRICAVVSGGNPEPAQLEDSRAVSRPGILGPEGPPVAPIRR